MTKPRTRPTDRISVAPIDREESAADRWSRFRPIRTGEDYIESLRNRGVEVWLFGERIEEPVDHPRLFIEHHIRNVVNVIEKINEHDRDRIL